MIGDLNDLSDNQNQLLMAEVAAWLHDMGKCSDEMIISGAWDKPDDIKYNRKTEYSDLLGDHTIDLLGEVITFKNLIENSRPTSASKEDIPWLIRVLGRCHGAAHIEKEECLSKNEKNDFIKKIKHNEKNIENRQTKSDGKRKTANQLEKMDKGDPAKLKKEAESLEKEALTLQSEVNLLWSKIKQVHQSKDHTMLSNPFGLENKKIAELSSRLKGLPFNQISNRPYMVNQISESFKYALGDTRRPTNEITLTDWSSIVAALYKSALGGALLGNQPEPRDLKWRLLAIRINSEQVWGNASSIPILLARKKWINDGLDNVKNLLEDIYPLGNEVYRDENGSVFVVPDIDDLLNITDSKENKSLKQLICEKSGYDGEVVVSPAHDLEKWWGQDPEYMMKKRDGRQDEIKNEIPPINKILKEMPYSPADPDAVKKWWNNTNKNPEICTISWLRPQDTKGLHRKASGHWAKKSTFRAEHWTSNRDETIWIDEIADANGRICLITGKLDILKWLEPEGYIKTLLVKPPDSNHNFDSKTPSFARIRRVWETTKKFWDDVNQDFNTIIDPISIRLKIEGIFKQKSGNISSNNAYEAKLNGIRFSIFHTKDGEYFIIENLQRLAQKLGASSQESKNHCSSAMFVKDQLHTKRIKIYDSEGKYKIKILGDLTLSQIELESSSYVPVIPIISEPSTFMAIIPANKAVEIAKHIKEKYEKEMGKVRNRLPLTLGLVFAKSHTPLPALMDAGRRMLEVSNKEEDWTLADDSLDCDLNCTLKFNNGITWNVPVKMGDGVTDDIWYPNFYVDGVMDDRSTAFEYPKGRWLVHVKELDKNDKVCITPSRFDFEFLDSASRRFEVSYNKEGIRRDNTKSKRPYLLEELDDFEKIRNILSEELSRTQIKNIIGLIESKREEWLLAERNDVFENYVHDVLHNANWKNGKPSELVEMENAAFSGKLRDVVELYMDILKIKGMED